MRLVIIGTAFPMRGGIAQYVALLCQTLKEMGHEVHVLSFKRQYPSIFFPGKTQTDEGRDLIPIDSIPILDSINPLTWIQAFFRLKKLRPDALIFKYWMPFFAPCYAVVGRLAQKFLGARLVYVCDNIVPHEKKIADVLLTKIGLKYPDGFICQSGSVREDLLSFRPDANYLDVPHPVYTIFSPAISKEEARQALGIHEDKVLLYFGFIRAYKGVNYLLKAVPDILKEHTVKVLICGEFYEGRDATLQLVRDLGIGKAVRVFDQFMPNEEVHQYFCAADLVVLPYVTATQSGVVQVAYNFNRPVVVTRVGGLPEVVIDGKTGYVVTPCSPQEIGSAVSRYYSERNTVTFEQNIEEEKKKYSWERMGEAVLSLASRVSR